MGFMIQRANFDEQPNSEKVAAITWWPDVRVLAERTLILMGT